jgi:hypothetical protein
MMASPMKTRRLVALARNGELCLLSPFAIGSGKGCRAADLGSASIAREHHSVRRAAAWIDYSASLLAIAPPPPLGCESRAPVPGFETGKHRNPASTIRLSRSSTMRSTTRVAKGRPLQTPREPDPPRTLPLEPASAGPDSPEVRAPEKEWSSDRIAAPTRTRSWKCGIRPSEVIRATTFSCAALRAQSVPRCARRFSTSSGSISLVQGLRRTRPRGWDSSVAYVEFARRAASDVVANRRRSSRGPWWRPRGSSPVVRNTRILDELTTYRSERDRR